MNAENEARKPQSWAPTVLVASAVAIAEFLYPLLISETRLGRWGEGALTVAILFGVFWVVGALVNLVNVRPWRSPSPRVISVVIALMVVNAIILFFNGMLHGGRPGGGTGVDEVSSAVPPADVAVGPKPHEAEVVNADGMKPYYGEVIPLDACPEGQNRVHGVCVDPAPRVVRRGLLGGCPIGYVDHPRAPELCALPYVAERLKSP